MKVYKLEVLVIDETNEGDVSEFVYKMIETSVYGMDPIVMHIICQDTSIEFTYDKLNEQQLNEYKRLFPNSEINKP